MSAFLIYITTGDSAEATRIGRALVQSRLAACANVQEKATSIYRWEGEVREDSEAVLIVKTREALIERVTEKVISLHSYDCPCIVALRIEKGNPAFIEWIESETRDAGS
jgi:periplasmic divalent cation tolerance protein